jgi:peptidyl-prolyl cis-trans isomerase B (cyclophilin B)
MKKMIRYTVCALLALTIMAAASAGCAKDAGGQRVEIVMESGGTILLELDAETAPITVENFISLAKDGFYDGLTFHRVIPGFVIQGGDPDGTGMGGSDKSIKGEFESNGVKNDISHKRGVISMARAVDKDSATSQFFITNADATSLDGEYAAFGYVIEGMDVVDEISAVPTDGADKPLEPVVIKTVKVL